MKWTKWTEELIKEKILLCKDRREFHSRFRGAELAAKRLSLDLDTLLPINKKLWTDEMLKQEASKYSSRSEFSKGNPTAYTLSGRRGILDLICPPAKTSPKRIWTNEAIELESKKYKSRIEFEEGSSSAYQAAMRYNLMDDLIPKMQGTSIAERDLCEYLKSLVPDFKTKRFHNDYELDCYSETLKLGIEYNGFYWHSEVKKDRNWHLNKTKYFEKLGIRVIHVWENEWFDRQDQVKNYLKSACKQNKNILYARKCDFKPIEPKLAKDFLNTNHIQGQPNSVTLAIGCYSDGLLFAVATFGRHHRKDGIVLNRFACREGTTIAGGLSKITKLALDHFKCDIISWADLCKSQATGYTASGWQLINTLKPDYFYFKQGSSKRISKQSRKKSRMNTPADMSEGQHARNDGLLRVWDCGKAVLIYRYTK